MTQVWRIIPALALSLAIATISGCGGGVKTVKVDGKLVKGQQPLAAEDGEKLNLSFVSEDAKDAKSFAADVSNDGTFVVKGGVPPGKYKININSTSGGNDTESLKKQATLNKRFSAVKDKPCEISSDPEQHLTIDIDSGNVTK